MASCRVGRLTNPWSPVGLKEPKAPTAVQRWPGPQQAMQARHPPLRTWLAGRITGVSGMEGER